MLNIPVTLVGVFPANTQLAALTLPKYRELLRKLKTHGSVEESSTAFQQAKERVLMRLQQRRERARLDPSRAFRRLQHRMLQASSNLRELKNQQRARLRQYWYEAVRGGTPAASRSTSPLLRTGGSSGSLEAGPALSLQQQGESSADSLLDPEDLQRTLGPNGLCRSLVLAGVGFGCKAFLHAASHTTVTGQHIMRSALERPPGQALITVSNHVGSIDDPLITAAVVPPKYLLKPEALRWTMCATDRCFKSKLLSPFFKAAKVLPVERGAGLSQYGMRVARSRLEAGEWVHIFPEGTRSRTGKMGPVRKGIGWLVASCSTPPLVVPFVHSGMERVVPKGAKLPQTGQEVRVAVGDPVPVADLLEAAQKLGWPQEKLQLAITERVGKALYSLKSQLEGVPLEEVVPQRDQMLVTVSEDTLLPLIEEEIDSMLHRWRERWQRTGVPSLTRRIRRSLEDHAAAVAAYAFAPGGSAGGGVGGSGGGRGEDAVLEGEGGQEGGSVRRGVSLQEGGLLGVGWRGEGRGYVWQGAMLRTLRGSMPSSPQHAGQRGVSAAGEAGGVPSLLGQLLLSAVEYSAERSLRVRQLVGGRGRLRRPPPPSPLFLASIRIAPRKMRSLIGAAGAGQGRIKRSVNESLLCARRRVCSSEQLDLTTHNQASGLCSITACKRLFG